MNLKMISVVGLIFILSYVQSVNAKEQSRDDFIASMKSDLLKPCSDNKFMECVNSNKSECVVRINNLMRDCKITLPATLTDTNLDESADKFSVCFSDGIIKKFSISEQEYNTCLSQKPH